MKKKLLSLLAIGFMGNIGFAQVQRMELYEEFTGENCPPCASTNPVIQVVANNNPNKIIFLHYQCNIPTTPPPGSLYQDNPSEVATRQTYYAVPFAPYARLDGSIIGGGANAGHAGYLTQDTVNKYYLVNAQFNLGITHTVTPANDSVKITVNISCAQNTVGTLKLQLALIETEIHFAIPPGTNGEKDFYNVMRKMVPNASGTALAGVWTVGQTQTLTFNVKLPSYLKNLTKLAVVGFIQDDANKRVHQSAISKPVPLFLDGTANSVNGISAFVCTPPNPALVITNAGVTTINNVNVSYKLNAGSVQTATYVGSILSLANATLNTPIAGMIFGTNTLSYTLTSVNGGPDYLVNNTYTTSFLYNANPTGTLTPYSYNFMNVAFPPANWSYTKAGLTMARSSVGNGNAGSFYANFYNDQFGYATLTMLPVDLTTITNPVLSFDRAYSGFYDVTNGLLYDTLKVFISTNCGTSWTQIYSKTNTALATVPTQTASYTPLSAADWANDNISLAAYSGANKAFIMFYGGTDYGNQLYVDNINVKAALGVKTLQNLSENVSLYPNPANGNATLLINLFTDENVTINVTNTLGQLIYTGTKNASIGQNTFNLNSEAWPSGVYNVSVMTTEGFTTKKLTISK